MIFVQIKRCIQTNPWNVTTNHDEDKVIRMKMHAKTINCVTTITLINYQHKI